MKTSTHSITLDTKDFPENVKQLWIKLDGIECHIVIGINGDVDITRYISKSKYPKVKRLIVKTYKY